MSVDPIKAFNEEWVKQTAKESKMSDATAVAADKELDGFIREIYEPYKQFLNSMAYKGNREAMEDVYAGMAVLNSRKEELVAENVKHAFELAKKLLEHMGCTVLFAKLQGVHSAEVFDFPAKPADQQENAFKQDIESFLDRRRGRVTL